MKTKFKKILLATASVMFSAACFGSLASYAANATTGNGEENLFTMNQGASVRKNKDTAGIRFSYTVTGAQYEKLQDEAQYTGVEYGMIISMDDVVSVEELYNAKESVFTDSAYTFDEEEWKADKTKKLLVNITGDVLVAEKDDQGQPTGDYLFNAALTNISEDNYTKAYVGMGYIKATPAGGEETYYFAENVKNTRTITYVAEKAQEANETDADGVIANYVTKGYAGLGLSGAGTEKGPYVVETADYEALKTATENGDIYGVGKCMSFAEGVDYSNLTADFADRNYNFVWAEADTTEEMELFNAPSKTAAAYYRDNEIKDKESTNASAQYHDEFEGRYGVVSLQSTHYFHNADNDFTTAASKDGAGVAGWRYYFASASGYTRASGAWDSEAWDYMSIWLYIAGEEGTTATIMEQYARNTAEVPCNTWYEFRYEQSNCITCFDDRTFNPGTSLYPPLFTIKGLDGYAVTEAFEQEHIFDLANNPTVYIDSITFEVDPIKSLAVAKVDGTKAQITAEQSGSIAETLDISYTVKSPAGTALTVEDDLTFATGVAGTYKVTATTEYNGETFTKTAEYTIETEDMMAANEIEGFYSADSVAAAYNVTHAVANTSATWMEKQEDKNGVIKYGILSMKPATTATGASGVGSTDAGGGYYLKSMVRDNTFYSFTGGVNNAAWDYISIWMYIPKPTGETATEVTVSAAYNLFEISAPFDTWFEYRLGKEYFIYRNISTSNYIFANDESTNSRVKNVLFCIGDEMHNDYTVYVDSFAYEKESEQLVNIATATGTDGSVTISVTPNVQGLTLTRADFVCTLRGYVNDDTTSNYWRANHQLKDDACTFTPNANDDIYYICISFSYQGIRHFAFATYVVPEATTTE